MHVIDLHVVPLQDNTKNGLSRIVNGQYAVVSLDYAYFIPIEDLEYGASLRKLRILHARVQSHCCLCLWVQYLGSFGELWWLYEPLSMQFSTYNCSAITYNHLCISVIHMKVKYSRKATAPLTGPGWILPVSISIPLPSLSGTNRIESHN